MNPKLLILGLILMIGICGVYGMDITSSGVYVVGSDINENEDVNIKADNVAIIGDNKQIGIVFIKKSDLKNITIIDLTIKELSINNYDNNRINLNNVAISGGTYGIYIYRGSENKISGNISKVYGEQYGIYIYPGNNNTIEGVNGEITGNTDKGIYIYGSENKISGNISKVYGGQRGIYIDTGNNNTIEGVNGEITGNGNDGYGISIHLGSENKISGNISKVYGEQYGIFIYKSDNNIIEEVNGEITGNTDDGIYIYPDSDNNKISGDISKVYGGQHGILISGSNNIIEEVNGVITGNGKDEWTDSGICIVGELGGEGSNNNKISGDISKVYGEQYGIFICRGNNNTIEEVNGEITGNTYDGIYIYPDSDNNKISGDISKVYGGRHGIYIYTGNNNTIEEVNGEITGNGNEGY
jgi:hypothetical protein